MAMFIVEELPRCFDIARRAVVLPLYLRAA